MADKNNAKCSICGGEYHACLSCKDSMKLQPWKIHCCSASHFQVFQVLRGYSTKVYTKDEAKEKLQNIDLDDLNYFRPHIKKTVKDILKENKLAAKAVEEVKTVEVIETVETVMETEVEDIKKEEVEKPIMSRKRNFRVETE